MAVIYYPKNQLLYIRDTVVSASNYESVVLACSPNTVLYFDTSSAVTAASAMNLAVTASWALTASVTLLFISSSYAATASIASTLLPSMPYTTIQTASATVYGITCSFFDIKEYLNIGVGNVTYYFTQSNVPTSGQYSQVSLFINNIATTTMSLSFPASWSFIGTVPTYLTASRGAYLNLEAFGSTIVAAWGSQY